MTPVWDDPPGALDHVWTGALVLTAHLWVPCYVAGWLLALPAALVRRYRGAR